MCVSRSYVVLISLLQRIKRGLRGRKVEGVGVMKDKQLKIEKIEASRTLGGARNAHTQKDF